MANRRMFTKQITDSDEFISLSSSAQALYFHLNMGADDDGFNNQIQNAMFKAHSTADDFNLLLNKKFIVRFESGVIVIKHWRVHNYIQNDRHKDTLYQEEISRLSLGKSGEYEVNVSKMDTRCIQDVSKMETQVRLGKVSIELDKDSIGEDSIVKDRLREGKTKKKYADDVTLTEEEHQKLVDKYGEQVTEELIEILSNYKGSSGKKYKSDYKTILGWVLRQWKEDHREKIPQQQSTADIIRQRLKERNVEF